ncbi:MAG: hypothetical protein HY926_05045 [Elusimicrobia bacterium]|nr:hypothetical protein [Elusimicrobiota bacterium]
MKNALLLTLALAGFMACAKKQEAPPPPPDCARGTHQEGDKCVSNGPLPAPASQQPVDGSSHDG